MYISKWIGVNKDHVPIWLSELIKNKDVHNKIVGKGEHLYSALVWNFVYLSTRCTRKCNFCSTKHITNDKVDMNDETFNRLCEWIPEMYHKDDKLISSVHFLGGEPLLDTPRIKKLMDSVFQKTPGMLGHVYTNGDLLDSINWNDLELIQAVRLNITDLSIDEIKRRIEIIKNKNKVPFIAGVLDEDSFDRIDDILRYVLENDIRHTFFRDINRGNDKEYIDNVIKKLHEMCDILEQYKSKGYKIKTDHFISVFTPRMGDRQHKKVCGNGSFAISPDGSVSCCVRGLYNNESKIGTIWDKKLYETGKEFAVIWEKNPDKIGSAKECSICKIKYLCGGGCTYARWTNNGVLTGEYPFCKINKEIFPRLEEIHMDN